MGKNRYIDISRRQKYCLLATCEEVITRKSTTFIRSLLCGLDWFHLFYKKFIKINIVLNKYEE